MAAKLTRLTHKIAIQLQLVTESYTICSSRFRRPVQKLLDNPPTNTGCVITSLQPVKKRADNVVMQWWQCENRGWEVGHGISI